MFAVGTGPGGKQHRTIRAVEAIAESDVIVGYHRYLHSIADLTGGKQVISSGMTQEVERCRAAIELAAAGHVVSLISSGDSGIYGMAGLAIDMTAAERRELRIEVVPGVTAASAAAAALGAPLMLDFAVISLSDLLVPWETIRRRLEAVAGADLVVALYNPKSKTRMRQLQETVDIFRALRPGTTPVGIATAAGNVDQSLTVTDLDHVSQHEVNMRSVVIIGSSGTRLIGGWLVTARGYSL